MAETRSTMMPLDTPAPDFQLPDTEGRSVSLHDFDEAKGLLVAFICNHCPFVRHIQHELARFADEFQPKGLAVVAINSNDAVAHPDDSPEAMAEERRRVGYNFPYLFDETQAVAKAYGAACTPDFFLFDRDRRLVYRGRFDSSSPGRAEPVTGADLRAAAKAMLAGDEISAEQYPSLGCNIKWKPGNEPD